MLVHRCSKPETFWRMAKPHGDNVFSSSSSNKYIKWRWAGYYVKVSCSGARTGQNLISIMKMSGLSKLASSERGRRSARSSERRPQKNFAQLPHVPEPDRRFHTGIGLHELWAVAESIVGFCQLDDAGHGPRPFWARRLNEKIFYVEEGTVSITNYGHTL
jgi:hypothetical protein